ncbi:MAG TPA: hypothetical protein VHJ18_13760 [Streptosporangiaceae bacterium]|jgi:hypothetical protein|nr:hypothetical protein [Streptosporangiaceae bacterium]
MTARPISSRYLGNPRRRLFVPNYVHCCGADRFFLLEQWPGPEYGCACKGALLYALLYTPCGRSALVARLA